MSDGGKVNLEWAMALLEGLIGGGVEEVVISPGSRSTPLTLAAILLPRLRRQVVLDERSAAFQALGLAKASGRPVALIATSGSAPGNWLPAVMEASAGGVPLILLSADRPWELQRCGANQTADQVGLFGSQVRAFHQLSEPGEGGWQRRLRALGRQLVLESLWPDPGPVHCNFPFREPLVPETLPGEPKPVEARPLVLPRMNPPDALVQAMVSRFPAGPGLLIAGAGAGEAAPLLELAHALGAPLLADSLSGLRFSGESSANLITAYPRFLEDEEAREALRPDWILQFGAMPVSAMLQRALKEWRLDTHWVVDPRGRWIDPLGLGAEMLPVQPEPLCRALLEHTLTREEPAWMYRWRQEEAGAADGDTQEAALIRPLLDALPDDSMLFCGNSLAIRWLDAWSGSGKRRIAVHGNRGLSGIDGNLSTFLGMARAWQGRGRKVALLGDLTFQHDLGALANAEGVDALVIVLNNGGGGIFDGLPQRSLPDYEHCWRTPQPLDLSALSQLFGVGFRQMEEISGMPGVLGQAFCEGGLQVVEIMLES